ncbi:MAG TPA: hypothetical protein VFJ97_07095 [Dermatophilaceae bacterium]|nr:hypothetical protein [Dermatophilaceae bacterium]
METIKIRDLRGSVVERIGRSGRLVGITNNRVLSAVMVPLSPAWIEHVLEENRTRVAQNVAEGEQERRSDLPLLTLGEALTPVQADVETSPPAPAALPSLQVNGAGLDTASGLALVRRLSSGLTRSGAAVDRDAPADPDGEGPGAGVRSVRMGDLDGSTLAAAAQAGDVIAVTNDRSLVAFLIPVTEDLVTHLIESNLSRVTYNVMRGEVERRSALGYTTIDEVVSPAEPARSARAVARRGRSTGRRAVAVSS